MTCDFTEDGREKQNRITRKRKPKCVTQDIYNQQ